MRAHVIFVIHIRHNNAYEQGIKNKTRKRKIPEI